MDLDEVDLALLDLYSYGDEYGVCPFQMHRLLQERITTAYLIASDIEDAKADDEHRHITYH